MRCSYDMLIVLGGLLSAVFLLGGIIMHQITTPCYLLEIGGNDGLLVYQSGDFRRALQGPVFEVDQADLAPVFSSVNLVRREKRNDSVTEYRFEAIYAARPDLTLTILVRVAEASPVLKFKLILQGAGCLTKGQGERLDYCSLQMEKGESPKFFREKHRI